MLAAFAIETVAGRHPTRSARRSGARSDEPQASGRVRGRDRARCRRGRRDVRLESFDERVAGAFARLRPESGAVSARAARARPRPRRCRRRARRAARTGGRQVGRLLDERARRSRRARRGRPRPPPRRPSARTPACPRSAASSCTSPRAASRRAREIVRQSAGAKHESEPVWHAGPVGRTRSSSASPSQSSRSSSTAIVLPDVAPLCQYSCARAAPEPRLARLARAALGLVVHPGEHQHAAGVGVLDDRGAELSLRRHHGAPPPSRAARRAAT